MQIFSAWNLTQEHWGYKYTGILQIYSHKSCFSDDFFTTSYSNGFVSSKIIGNHGISLYERVLWDCRLIIELAPFTIT